MQEVKVSVTQELIDKNKHRCNECPVYDAMKAAGVPVVLVMGSYWVDQNFEFPRSGEYFPPNVVHNFPVEVAAWIRNYDAFVTEEWASVPKPFEFTVEF